ncbi:MAG: hypothetical protein HQL70_06580 [Magnetococcales bacterium]|nr:hypothetical protein [Magnetococcales bacterium]
MKKSLILGAAAMAALVAVPQADAAEVDLGGYYMMRYTDSDATLTDTVTNNDATDDQSGWFQRMQLDVDAKISDKTSAHIHMRPMGSSDAIQGANDSDAGDSLDIKRVWMETEMYGVGIKIGNMPLSINDKILFKDDGGSYGTTLLAKSFGDMTVVGLNVRVSEGLTSTGNADTDQADIYGLSLVGKAGNVNYQLTWAHLDIDDNFANAAVADSTNNWGALSVGTDLGGVNLHGTAIWEGGHSGGTADTQRDGSDFLAALRLNGKTGFGGWKAYGVYAGEDFSHPQSTYYTSARTTPDFSPTWRQGGPGGVSLLETWAKGAGTGTTTALMQNMWAVGAGVDVKAGAWTISPSVDYAAVVEKSVGGTDTTDSASAWGGTLSAKTSLDEGTTFALIGKYVAPSDDDAVAQDANGDVEDMHSLQAEFKVKF